MKKHFVLITIICISTFIGLISHFYEQFNNPLKNLTKFIELIDKYNLEILSILNIFKEINKLINLIDIDSLDNNSMESISILKQLNTESLINELNDIKSKNLNEYKPIFLYIRNNKVYERSKINNYIPVTASTAFSSLLSLLSLVPKNRK